MSPNEIEELKQQVLTVLSFYNVENGAVENVCDVFELYQAFPDQEAEAAKPVFMKFNQLPKGARFKYPDGDDVWIVIGTYGIGKVAKWNGLEDTTRQSLCCFVDEEWALDSEVQVIG